MGKKPNWLRILTETIGIPTIITIIIGVPAMIAFVSAIWQALTFSHRVIAIMSGSVLLIVIILFVYFQTLRKKLYIIPDLLREIDSVTRTYAMKIKLTELDKETFANFFELIDVGNDLMSVTNESEARSVLDELYPQIKDKTLSDADKERAANYLLKKYGLQKLLEQDKTYIKLVDKLNKMRYLVPSEDIISAINDFEKLSTRANAILPFLPIFEASEPYHIYPVKMEADLIDVGRGINDGLVLSLVKIRQSIDKYYRR